MERDIADIIDLDFSKAFDTLSLYHLIVKMKYLGTYLKIKVLYQKI